MRSSLTILPLAALLACGGGSSSTGPGTTGGTNNPPVSGGSGPVATTAVDIKNLTFTPSDIKVASGATVTWTNSDGIAHNITFDAGANVAGAGTDFSSGSKSLVMPTAAATYNYHCTRHGGMTGTVQVQ